MDKIPEKFLNQDGTLNTDALMKSYNELERKIGTMITVPDDNSDSDTRARFNRAIGVPDTADEYPKNEIFDDENVRKKFHEIGLTSTQVEKIYSIANEYLSPIVSELFSIQDESNAVLGLKSDNVRSGVGFMEPTFIFIRDPSVNATSQLRMEFADESISRLTYSSSPEDFGRSMYVTAFPSADGTHERTVKRSCR